MNYDGLWRDKNRNFIYMSVFKNSQILDGAIDYRLIENNIPDVGLDCGIVVVLMSSFACFFLC